MKKIHLHSAVADNAGGFHDAGSELTVGPAAAAGMISLDRAKAMLSRNAAVIVGKEEAAAEPAKA